VHALFLWTSFIIITMSHESGVLDMNTRVEHVGKQASALQDSLAAFQGKTHALAQQTIQVIAELDERLSAVATRQQEEVPHRECHIITFCDNSQARR
jgi:hypothetical protein